MRSVKPNKGTGRLRGPQRTKRHYAKFGSLTGPVHMVGFRWWRNSVHEWMLQWIQVFDFRLMTAGKNPDLENRTLFIACLCEYLKGAWQSHWTRRDCFTSFAMTTSQVGISSGLSWPTPQFFFYVQNSYWCPNQQESAFQESGHFSPAIEVGPWRGFIGPTASECGCLNLKGGEGHQHHDGPRSGLPSTRALWSLGGDLPWSGARKNWGWARRVISLTPCP